MPGVNAAGVGDIGLDVVGTVEFKELAVFVTVVEPFPGGDGNADAFFYFAHTGFVIRGDGFFKPKDVEIFQTKMDITLVLSIVQVENLY